jgi:hypothetical protein
LQYSTYSPSTTLPSSEDSATTSQDLTGFSTFSVGSVDIPQGPRYSTLSIMTWVCSQRCNSLPLVYYRVYWPSGAVKVKDPECSEDPYLGRTLAIHVTPPHTVFSIKRHLCGRETTVDHTGTSLFADISCLAPLKDTELVDILSPVGLGSVLGHPVALVVLETLDQYPAESNSTQTTSVSSSPQDPSGYIYKIQATSPGGMNTFSLEHFLMLSSSNKSWS